MVILCRLGAVYKTEYTVKVMCKSISGDSLVIRRSILEKMKVNIQNQSQTLMILEYIKEIVNGFVNPCSNILNLGSIQFISGDTC